MDTNEQRRKIEQSIAKVVARRPKAAVRGSTANDAGIVANKKKPAKARVEALGRVTRAEGPATVPHAALQRLADRKETLAVRLAAIKLLQQKQFFSPASAEWRPAFVEALRAAVDHPQVRAAALEVLSLLKDRPTQELLLTGIRNPRRALVPLDQALRLLSTDIHADVIAVARKLTTSPRLRRNKAALLQAVRILGADPGSTGTLEKVLANDAYSLDARRLAATALSHLAPGPAPGPVRRGSAAAGPAKAKGALATHLDTLRRIRQ
jgi:hypothetical protein